MLEPQFTTVKLRKLLELLQLVTDQDLSIGLTNESIVSLATAALAATLRPIPGEPPRDETIADVFTEEGRRISDAKYSNKIWWEHPDGPHRIWQPIKAKLVGWLPIPGTHPDKYDQPPIECTTRSSPGVTQGGDTCDSGQRGPVGKPGATGGVPRMPGVTHNSEER